MQQPAPARQRWADADAEKAQAGLDGDDDGNVHARQDEDRADDIGQDMLQQDAPGLGPQHLLGLEIEAVADGQSLGAGDAAELGNEGDADQEDQIGEPRAQHRHQRQGQDQPGKRVDDVEDGEDELIDRPRRIGRDHAEQDADGEGDRQDHHRHADGDAGAIDGPAEQIAAELVGAEEMREGGTLQPVDRRDGVRVVRGEQRGEDRHDQQQGDSDKPEGARARRHQLGQKPAPGHALRSPPLASRARTRGSIQA